MGFSDADMMGRGGKTGSGRQASESQENQMRRERLRKLALETVDLNKDPYFMRNHLGTYECKLCLTIHTNEGNYLAHTQGKRHQQNIARRLAKDAFEQQGLHPGASKTDPKTQKKVAKIGRPGYRVTKQKCADSEQRSLLFLIDFPEIEEGLQPRHRFMSAYEQRVEPADKSYQYILVAAEPYETIAFKVNIHLCVDVNVLRVSFCAAQPPRHETKLRSMLNLSIFVCTYIRACALCLIICVYVHTSSWCSTSYYCIQGAPPADRT